MENRLNKFDNTGNISYNGALKKNEVLPDFALTATIRLQTKVNAAQLGESLNDGQSEFVAQTFEACIEDDEVGYTPDDELHLLKRLARAVENRMKKLALRIQNRDRRNRYAEKQNHL